MNGFSKRVILYVIGIFILSLGISMIVSAGLGAAPWDLLSVAVGGRLSLSVGTSAIVIQIVVLFITKLIFKEKLEILSVIPVVIQGMFMNIMLVWLETVTMKPYVLLVLGSLISAIGVSIYAFQGLSSNPVDNFTLAIHRNLKLTLGKSKVVSDLLPLVIIVLLGVIPHYTTILVYLLVPFFLEIVTLTGITKSLRYEE